MSQVSDRLAAARTLGRVLRTGAWANVATRTETRDGSDLRTVQSLVMGALRVLPWLDRRIGLAAGRSLDRIDPGVLDLLRVGAHELTSGSDRAIPVVVDTVVSAASEAFPRAKGFVNAVMRRLSEMGPSEPDLSDLGYAPWLVDRLRRVLGDEVESFLTASQSVPGIGLRSVDPVDGATVVTGIPEAWLWTRGAPPAGVAVQDPASVAVGAVVDAEPGHTVLDVAAAPGGKTSHLVAQTGSSGMVVAVDRHARRARDARRRVPEAHWLVADGTSPPFLPATFDRVLVDAPCTGLGTLRRRPEIRYRVSPEEIARLARIQRGILEASLPLVRPGGRLVYSVCTVTPDETVDIIAGLGGHPPDGIPGEIVGDGLVLGPHLGPTDGMFIAVFDR